MGDRLNQPFAIEVYSGADPNLARQLENIQRNFESLFQQNVISGTLIEGDFEEWLATLDDGYLTNDSGDLVVQEVPIPVADGGTGLTTFAAGDLVYASAATTLAGLTIGSAGKIIRSTGTLPAYSTFTIPDTFAQGDVIYGSATNVLTALAKDTNATRYLSNTGTSNNPTWAQVAISTGVSGLGSGVATFLATPSSANLISAVTDETGTGSLVFSNTPSLVTPAIGAATGTSIVLTESGTFGGDVICTTDAVIRRSTSDGSDTGAMGIMGGGASGAARGAGVNFYGNEHSTQPGNILMTTGGPVASFWLLARGSDNAELLRITSDTKVAAFTGVATFASDIKVSSNIGIDATKRIYLDGVALTGDTYFAETSANTVAFTTGGSIALTLTSGQRVQATSDGDATAPTWSWTTDTNMGIFRKAADQIGFATAGAERGYFAAGLVLGVPSGGDQGGGTLNVAANVYLNASAYTNPDYVFEHYFHGKIEQFKDNPGASRYNGLPKLGDLKQELSHTLRFPQIDGQKSGIFDRADILLEICEQQQLYLFELYDRVNTLENKLLN